MSGRGPSLQSDWQAPSPHGQLQQQQQWGEDFDGDGGGGGGEQAAVAGSPRQHATAMAAGARVPPAGPPAGWWPSASPSDVAAQLLPAVVRLSTSLVAQAAHEAVAGTVAGVMSEPDLSSSCLSELDNQHIGRWV